MKHHSGAKLKMLKSFFHLLLNTIYVVLVLASFAHADSPKFVNIVSKISPSVVAIGLYTPIEQKGNQVLGTGFIVGEGRYAITNYHVVSKILDPQIVQYFVVISGQGSDVSTFKSEVLAIDPVHDLALLEIDKTLPPMRLGKSELLRPGSEIAFTGFPLGAAIGLYPATHRGLISAITPDAIPARNADQLTLSVLKRLEQPELVYQLDATAFPGNSGSPIYDPATGEVIAVLNKVFVSQGKEAALSTPSGISYGIPVSHVHALLDRAKE